MKKYKKNSGFKIPEGYLEGFTEKLRDQIKEPSSPEAQKGVFKVPSDYWEKLETEVLQKTTELNKARKKSLRLEPYFLVAAAIAVILILTIGLNTKTTSEKDLSFSNVEEKELLNYFEEIYLEESSNELLSMIPEEDLSWTLDDNMSVEDENIINYLEDTIDEMDDFNLYEDEEL